MFLILSCCLKGIILYKNEENLVGTECSYFSVVNQAQNFLILLLFEIFALPASVAVCFTSDQEQRQGWKIQIPFNLTL